MGIKGFVIDNTEYKYDYTALDNAPVPDATLSQSGYAADAKSTGDQIADKLMLATLMPDNATVTVTGRKVTVKKNRVVVEKVSASSAYRCFELLSALEGHESTFGSADLTEFAYVPVCIDTDDNDLMIAVQWDAANRATKRNQLFVATMNSSTNATASAEVVADDSDVLTVVSLTTLLPAIATNKQFQLVYQNRNADYANGIRYWLFPQGKNSVNDFLATEGDTW